MRIEKVRITPKLAKEMLAKNTNNRPLKIKRIAMYADEIKAGKWKADTGELIKIAKDGTLLDGQHRLSAIVKSGATCDFHVGYDMEESIFDVIDTGVKRTNVDALALISAKNANYPAPIVRLYIKIKTETTAHRQVVTNADIIKEYNANTQRWDGMVANVVRWYRVFNRILNYAIMGGYYAAFFEIDKDKAFEFFEQLSTGENISNPTVNVLRNLLTKDRISNHKMPTDKKVAILIKTWNCFLSGTTLQRLIYDPAIDSKIEIAQPIKKP